MKNDDELKEFFKNNKSEIPKAPKGEFQSIMAAVEKESSSFIDDILMFFKEILNQIDNKPRLAMVSFLSIAAILFVLNTPKKEIMTLTQVEVVNLISIEDSEFNSVVGNGWL